jgi:lipopolysaccharide biosynthesis glycosyltransferase
MKTAVVILATGEYWKGAKVMFHTLRKYGNLPDWVNTIALGAECIDGPPLKHDWSSVLVSQKNFPRVAAKFEALTLGYDRVIMLDADMLCIDDCSLLWSEELTKPFYAVRDRASRVYYGRQMTEIGLNASLNFNGGTMIFNYPDILSNLLTAISDGLQSYDGGDQGYLNAFFQLIRPDLEVGFLPAAYNCVLDINFEQVPNKDKRIIHFTGGDANPWESSVPESDYRRQFFDRWKHEWEDCQ